MVSGDKMAFGKFRAFMDVGRVQGVPVTAAIAILGSLTASSSPAIIDLFWLVVISILAHMGGAALNELWDRNLDSAVPELARKPLVSGSVSPGEARVLIAVTVPASLLMTAVIFGIPAFVAIVIATIWMHWYCTTGKRTFIVNDFSQCVGFGSFALFGALAVGFPTLLTWPLIGVVATLNLFAQWGNGLKDADNDRRFGIPSLAVQTGVTSARGLTGRHPYFLYGVSVKSAFLLFCTLPMLLTHVPMSYMFIVLALGYPVQYFTLHEFLGPKTRPQYVKLLLGDLLLSYPAAAAISILNAGLAGLLLLAVFVFGGYLIGSALQSGAEFKFGQYARLGHGSGRSVPPHKWIYINRNPILITWARKGPSHVRPPKS
jgi:4-hydroxybenzoate polyprenyltransferase